jgi:small subunit ribosomal protein S4
VTKIVKSKYKVSRRLGVNLWGRAKDPFNTRNFPPGQHGAVGFKKPSDYGTQLKAKQKLKAYYGNILEKQFRLIFKEATRLKGDTGTNLIGLLERRIDAVVYRLNLAPTIFAARQLVNHKHIKVNGKTLNIISARIKEGDVIEVSAKSREIPIIIDAVKKMEREVPGYLEFDAKAMKGTFLRTPALADVPYPVQMEPNLVIEFYSR